MPYPVYATVEDVKEFLGLPDRETLPYDIDRIIKRASELIYFISLGNVDVLKKSHLDVTRLATCAQVEYWIASGENSAITGNSPTNFSIGDISMNYGGASTLKDMLAPRARFFLNSEGLLYRGLRW